MTHRSLEPYSLSIRLAATAEEVLEGARVRHDVYSRTEGLRLLDSLDTTTGLDVDVYDFWAHHLVMVLSGPQGEQVVGTMRVVMDEPSPQRELLLEALTPYPHLIARLHEQRPAPLPMMSYLTQADVVREHYDAARASGLRVAEPGRLAVTGAAIRLAGRARVSLGDFFVRAALAYGFGLLGLDRVYVDCFSDRMRLYQNHGFSALANADFAPAAMLKRDVVVLCAGRETVPAEMRSMLRHMTRQFAVTSSVALRCASESPRVAA